MLEPYPKDDGFSPNWDAMGVGAPTITSLARLCAEAITEAPVDVDDLMDGISE